MNDAAFRRYQHWADRRMEDLVRRMQTRLKGIKPDVALVTWTTNAGRFGHFLDIPRNMPARMNLLFDAPDQEFWLDETNRGSSVVPAFGAAYIWAITNHRVAFSEPYLMSHGNPYGKDSFPAHEIERRMMLALTYGAAPSIAVAQPEHLKPALKHCLDEVKKRQAVADAQAARAVGRDPGERQHAQLLRPLRGAGGGAVSGERVRLLPRGTRGAPAVHGHQRLEPRSRAPARPDEVQGAGAAEHRVPGRQAGRRHRLFVERGGGLVASLDTGLCDEFGTPRKQPALAEVLGVNYKGTAVAGKIDDKDKIDENFARTLPPDYWQKRKGVWDFKRSGNPLSFLESEQLTALIGKGLVTFKGPVARAEPLPGSVIDATVRTKDNAKADELPAVVSRKFGAGKTVYLAAGIDAAHYSSSYPYYRVILAQAIRWAAPAPPSVEVAAPMCVHATTVRQKKDGERLNRSPLQRRKHYRGPRPPG